MKVSELFESGKHYGNAQNSPSYDERTGHMLGSAKDWLKLGNVSQEDVKKAISIVKSSDLFKSLEAEGIHYEPRPKSELNGTLQFAVNRHERSDDEKTLKSFKAGSSKDSIVRAALIAMKSHDITKAKNIIDAARREGKDYEEFKVIEKSIGTQFVSKYCGRDYKGFYSIYANGQIRSASGSRYHGQDAVNLIGPTRLKSLKPRMVPGDPVKSLVKTYTAAIERMLQIWKASKVNQKSINKSGSKAFT